jgi:hypothetical protein
MDCRFFRFVNHHQKQQQFVASRIDFGKTTSRNPVEKKLSISAGGVSKKLRRVSRMGCHDIR